jgi:hypothetical protein
MPVNGFISAGNVVLYYNQRKVIAVFTAPTGPYRARQYRKALIHAVLELAAH